MRICKEKNTAQNRHFKCSIFHHYIAIVSQVTTVKLMDWNSKFDLFLTELYYTYEDFQLFITHGPKPKPILDFINFST